jgi:hypothetical protein
MKAPAVLLALWLVAPLPALAQTAPSTPAPEEAGEPLPPGAPSAPYELSAWCYGALSEYLDIYERVLPDLRDIDKMFGSSEPNEPQPYADDIAEARKELVVLGGAVEAAEKASDRPIAPRGVIAVKQGRSIWAPAELKTRRELARAWLSWALPDRCDSTARTLAANSALLGAALKFNTPPPDAAPSASAETGPGDPPTAPSPSGAGPQIASGAPAKPPASDPAASPTSETAPSAPTPATQPPAATEPAPAKTTPEPGPAPTPTPTPSPKPGSPTTPAPDPSPTAPPPTDSQPSYLHPPM